MRAGLLVLVGIAGIGSWWLLQPANSEGPPIVAEDASSDEIVPRQTPERVVRTSSKPPQRLPAALTAKVAALPATIGLASRSLAGFDLRPPIPDDATREEEDAILRDHLQAVKDIMASIASTLEPDLESPDTRLRTAAHVELAEAHLRYADVLLETSVPGYLTKAQAEFYADVVQERVDAQLDHAWTALDEALALADELAEEDPLQGLLTQRAADLRAR